MNHNDWNTPPEFASLVRRLDARRQIGLDPCSNGTSIVDARVSYTKADDGLSRQWRGHGLVYVNPEYTDLAPWVAKGRREFVDDRATGRDQLVMLVTSKTDTLWFHDLALRFDRLCFLRGRMRFLLPVHRASRVAGTGRFASLVLYAGEHGDTFARLFGPLGWIP